jgi:hypothetical protein
VADQPRALPLAFRQVQMSPIGWTSLLAPGAAAGLTVGLIGTHGRLRPGPMAAATLSGALIGVILARVVDELRWRRSAVCIELAEPDAVLDLLQAVRAAGVHADMIRASRGPAGTSAGYALRYRARDDRRVRAVLSAQQN